MLTYYAAQLGIAVSVVDSYESHEVNHLVIQHQDLIKGIRTIYHHLKSICFEENLDLINMNNQVTTTNEDKIDTREHCPNASSINKKDN